jgi:glyoxylase-like metal-dependent hydrolase (beta-lactamase superfamily II)
VLEGADGALAVIDPGWGTADAMDVLERGIAATGHTIDDVTTVVVTHLHVDHLGAAQELRRRGAVVYVHAEEQAAVARFATDRELASRDIASWGLPEPLRAGVEASWGAGRRLPAAREDGTIADVLLRDGDVVPVAGRPLRAVWTPGHTTGHLCFVDETDGLLFTGDHVLPRINSGLGLGGRTETNPLEDYLASLRRLDGYAAYEVCPGHEYRFLDVTSRAAVLAEHRAERSGFVAAALDALDSPTLYEVAARVPFRGGIESMEGYLLASAVWQTGLHVRALGRADEVRPA